VPPWEVHFDSIVLRIESAGREGLKIIVGVFYVRDARAHSLSVSSTAGRRASLHSKNDGL